MKVTEKDIQNEIRAILESAGALVWKNYTGPVVVGGKKFKNSNAGQPDIFAVMPGGRFVAIEVKKPGARTDKARLEKQNEWVRRFHDMGAIAMLTDDPERVRAELLILGIPF